MRYTCRECSSRPQVQTCSPANCRSPRCTECSRTLTSDNRIRRNNRSRIDASTTCDNSTCQFRRKIKQFTPETSDDSLDYRHHKNRKETKSVRCTCDENSINSEDSFSHSSKSRKTKICTPYICSFRQGDKLLLDAGTTYNSPSKPYKSYNEVTCICSDNLQRRTEYSDDDLYHMKHRSVSCGVCLEPSKSVSTQENYECLAECPFKTNRATNTLPCTPPTCKNIKMPKQCNAKTCPRFVDFRAKGTKVSSTESEVTSCDSSCLKYADVTDDKSSLVEQTTGDGDQPTSDLTKTSSRTSQDQESSEPCAPESCLYHTEESETVCEAMLRSVSSKASEPCSPDTCWFHTTDEIETTCQSIQKADGDGEIFLDDGSKKSITSEKTKSTSGRGSKQSLTSEKTLTNITEHDSITSTSGHASKSSLTSHTLSSLERAKLEGRDSCIKECMAKVCSTCKESETTDKESEISSKQTSAMEATGGITDELLLQVVDLSDAASKAHRPSLSDTSSARRSKLGIPPDGIMSTPSEQGSASGDVLSGHLAMNESDGFEYDSNGQLVACRRKDSSCRSPSKIARHGSAEARSRTSSGEIIQYDSKGQVIPRRKDGPHHTASRTSSEMARLGGVTSSGQIIQYDSKGQVIPRKKRDGPHHTASRTSSEMARLGGVTPSGYIYQYDSKGQVIPREKRDGPHHTASRTSSEMARLGGVTPSGYVYQYDSKGQVIPREKRDGPHHTASRTSSEMARLGGVTPSGYVYQYDSKGQVIPREKRDGPHHTASRTSSEMARLGGVTSSDYIYKLDSKGHVIPRGKRDGPHHTASRTSSEMARLGGVTPSGRIIQYDSKGQVVLGRKKDGPHHTASRTSSEMARLGGVSPSGQLVEYDATGQAIARRRKDAPHHTDSRTSSEMARLGVARGPQVTPSGRIVDYDSKGQLVQVRRKDGPRHTDSRTSSEMARLGGVRGPQVTPSGRIVEYDSKGKLVPRRTKDGFDEYDETVKPSFIGKTKGRGRGEPGGDDSGEEFDADGRRLPQKPSDFSTTLDYGTKKRGGPGDQDEDTPSRGRGVTGVDSSLTKLLSASDDKRATKPGLESVGSRGFLELGDVALDGKGVGSGLERHLPGCRCKKCKKIGCSCGAAEGFQPFQPPGCHCNNCKLTICRCETSGPKAPNDCGCNECDESKHPDNCDCVDCLCDPSRFQKDKGQEGGDHDRREARPDDDERRGRSRRGSKEDEGGRGGRRGRRGDDSGGRRGCGGKGGGGRKPRKGRRGKGRDEESDETSSSGHPSDCDCDECLCAPSEISAGKKPRKADVHPPDCDCVDCICKPCLNRLCVMKKAFVCPTLMPLTKRQHPDCKCDNCICDECLHVPDCKCRDCKCRRCADEKVHRAKQKCTCPECICHPCGDTTKHPRDEYHGEDCTCTDCLCAPCDDTRVGKEKTRHPPTCVCYLCSCKNCADPRINPPTQGPSMFQTLVESANACNFTPIQYEIPHGPNCKCVTCTCRACDEPRSFVERKRDPSKSVGIDTHGPDCYCPQCFCNPCKTKQDAYTPAPVLDDKKECVCDKCTCNPCDDPIFLTRRDKENIKNQLHGDGCQCPTCLAAANRNKHNHGEGCQCPLCLAEVAAAKKPHHGEGCMCPLCLPAEAKHGPDCKCPKCVCKPCEMDAKPSAHGPNCKCPICVCKPCEMDAKPSAHGPNCKCPICVCDPCRQDEPVKDHGSTCKCAVCKPGVDKKVTPEKPTHTKCPNCKCLTCVCDPCDKDGQDEPEKRPQHGPNCKCPTCTCDPCDKDEPAKQQHGPDCRCPTCVCSPCEKDSPEGQTQHKKECTCDRCVCDPCDDPTFSASKSKQVCKCDEEPVKQGVDYKYIDQLIQASKAPVSCVCNSKGKPTSHPPGCRCSPCSKKATQATTRGIGTEVYSKSTQCVCKKKHLQSAKVSKASKVGKVNKVNRQNEIDEIECLLVNLRAVCCEAKARQAEPPKEPLCNMTDGAMLALMQELRSKTSCNVVQQPQQAKPQKEKGKKGSCFCGSPTKSTTPNKGGSASLQITEVSRISDESVLVKWTQPKNSNVTGYEITVDDAVQSKVHSCKRTSAVIFGIQSRRRIRIAVHVITPQGRSGNPALSVYEG